MEITKRHILRYVGQKRCQQARRLLKSNGVKFTSALSKGPYGVTRVVMERPFSFKYRGQDWLLHVVCSSTTGISETITLVISRKPPLKVSGNLIDIGMLCGV